MRLRSNRNTEEPNAVSGHFPPSAMQPRRAEGRRTKRMAPANRDEKSAKRKVQVRDQSSANFPLANFFVKLY